MTAAVAALSLLGAGGCHRYVAIPPESARPDEEVQVHFTPDAAVRLAQQTGTISPSLEGRLSPYRADSLELSLWIGRNFPGTEFADVHQVVPIARSEVVEVRRRELSVGRTALASAVTLAVFAILVDRVFLQEDPNAPGGQPPPPPPDASLVPFRWRR